MGSDLSLSRCLSFSRDENPRRLVQPVLGLTAEGAGRSADEILGEGDGDGEMFLRNGDGEGVDSIVFLCSMERVRPSALTMRACARASRSSVDACALDERRAVTVGVGVRDGSGTFAPGLSDPPGVAMGVILRVD